jgi:hypothetical protein
MSNLWHPNISADGMGIEGRSDGGGEEGRKKEEVEVGQEKLI